MITLKQISVDLKLIANTMAKGERCGEQKDSPEGARYLIISDTFAKIITKKLNDFSKEIDFLSEPSFLKSSFDKAAKKAIAKENKKRSTKRSVV